MKVINVKHFASKGLKREEDVVYFIEGVEHKAILRYNLKTKRLTFFFVDYVGKKKSIDEISKEVHSNVPLIARLKSHLDKSEKTTQLQLGKAKFQITEFSKKEADFYTDKSKGLIKIFDKHELADKTYLYGSAEIEDFITFVSNLEKVDIQEYKNQPEQLAMNLD